MHQPAGATEGSNTDCQKMQREFLLKSISPSPTGGRGGETESGRGERERGGEALLLRW